MNLTKHNIVLGSNSPRRKEILSQMGFDFKVIISDKEEKYPTNLKEKEVSEFLSIQKADHLKENLQDNDLLITADTIVVCDNIILNKPKDKLEATEMLLSISGKTHKVITSVCLQSVKKRNVFSEETLVTFSKLTEEMISFYIEKFQPFDKAGSYGIQEWIGLISIEKIEGSYTNVVGLPSSKLFQRIRNF